MKIRNLLFVFISLSAIFFQGCAIADLRTNTLKDQPISQTDEEKGRDLLRAAWKAQGMDKLNQFETYEVTAKDHWKGMFGAVGNVWPVNQTPMKLRFAVGTFDSQMEVLEGKKKGFVAGQQSWNYYEKEDGELEFKEKLDKRISFGLSAYQYFFELTDRLMRAPIVVYAGETVFEGQEYDMVLASWETIEPHKGHDQYRLWINKETKMMEVVENTVRANYLPGAQHLYGSTTMKDYKEINGIYIPFKMSVYLNEPNKKEQKYVHRLSIEEFKFDAFDKSMLYPNPNLKSVGDAKLDSE